MSRHTLLLSWVFLLGMNAEVLCKYLLEDNSPWVIISLLFLNSTVGLVESVKEFSNGC